MGLAPPAADQLLNIFWQNYFIYPLMFVARIVLFTVNFCKFSYEMSFDSDTSLASLIYRLLNKTVKQWGSIPVRGFDQSRITSKFTTIHSTEVLAAVANSFSKQSLKSEMRPANCRRDFGSTAFINWSQSGRQSSSNSGCEDCVIQVDHLPHDSAATDGSLELASPALHNTPAASDESVLTSALLENNDDDGQPPPDRSLFDIERGLAPPQVERRLNPSSLAKICPFVSCEVCLAPSEIRYNAGTSLSANANTLLLFAQLFGVVGFLLSLGAHICQRRRRASVVMTVMGGVATISGLLSILGTRFPEKAMLWLTAALCAMPMSASPFAVYELI